MSETTSAPQDGGAADAPEPAVSETTAPVETGAATETETQEKPAEPPKPSREDRRIASLSARLSAGEQERARLAAELESYRQRLNPEPERPINADDIPRIVEERVKTELAQRETKARVDSFHAAGRAAYPDWQDRCQSLMQMGADAQMAELLIETPDGAKVAAALSDDPEEMERIAGIRTERGRAIALGKYAAAMEQRPAPPARVVSRAPEPIRPLGNGTARTAFNEATATMPQLVEHYFKQQTTKH